MPKHYICPKCYKSLHSKKAFNYHYYEARNCLDKKSVCGWCDRAYSHRKNLMAHLKICKKRIEKDNINDNSQKDYSESDIQNKSKIELTEKLHKKIEKLHKEIEIIKQEKMKVENKIIIQNNTLNNSMNNTFNYNRFTKTKFINALFPSATNFNIENYNMELDKNQLEQYIKCGCPDGVTEYIKDKIIDAYPVEKRSIWCIDKYRRIYLVRINDKWKSDDKGVKFAIPNINIICEKLSDYCCEKICKLNEILAGSSEDESYSIDEVYEKEIEEERMMYYQFAEDLNKNKLTAKVLKDLTPYIIFEKTEYENNDTQQKLIKHFQ